MKKEDIKELFPGKSPEYSIYNDHHTGVLSSDDIEDFKKIPDFRLDTKDVELTERDENGRQQVIIYRKGYKVILTRQEDRNLKLSDELVYEYLMELATPLKSKCKEEMKLIIDYNHYFGEVKHNGGTTKQKNSLINSLEKLNNCYFSFKKVDDSGTITGVTPFNMFSADYTKRGRIEIFINPLYNRYVLQRASEKPRSKVIQRMDPKNDATAIYIMRAIDNYIGQNDPIKTDDEGHKIWRLTVKNLLEETYSLKRAKDTVFNLKGLPGEGGIKPVKEKDPSRPSDVHTVMIPFIEGLNKCTENYSGTRGLISWRFVKPGGKALSMKEKEQVTYIKGKPTNKLNFNTFLEMTIEIIPYEPANMRPKEEREQRKEGIIKRKEIAKSKRKK